MIDQVNLDFVGSSYYIQFDDTEKQQFKCLQFSPKQRHLLELHSSKIIEAYTITKYLHLITTTDLLKALM